VRAQSRAVRRWDAFRASMKRCVAVPLSDRGQCLAEARDGYRSANINCSALPGGQHKECLKYAKLWADTETDVPTAEAQQDEGPAATPATPEGEPPAEPSWDSTLQQQDSVGNEPAPTNPN
jgi:hypothetical protein